VSGPEVGDIAPDAVLMDTDGRHVHLSASWTDQPAVVVFLRYFGCPFCQAQVVTLRRDDEGHPLRGRQDPHGAHLR